MRQRKLKLATMAAIPILASGWCAQAEETNGEATEASPNAWTEFWDAFHHPTPWLEMGLDHRFRTVYAQNIITLNDDDVNSRRNYQRYRTRWSTKWIPGEDIDLNARLAWEFRTWDEPPSEDRNTNFDEALFDRMNLTTRNMFGMPLAGRTSSWAWAGSCWTATLSMARERSSWMRPGSLTTGRRRIRRST